VSGKSFIAQLRTRPDKRADMIHLQSELKHLVFEHEPDAIVYELFQSDTDADLFQVVATFRNDEAFEKHMSIDFHERLVPEILDCLAQDMKLDFYRSLS
jgi:quinol monooxygenase YgiN